jgi:septal ring factor EnvC (AmiA/AmiB activator)
MRKNGIFLSTAIASFFFVCAVFLPLFSAETFAASPRDEYKKVQRDLRKQKKKLVEATRAERTVTHDLRVVESHIGDITEQISAAKKKIDSTKGSIAELERQIAEGSGRLDAQRQRLRKRLRTLQKINDSKEIMLMLISHEDPSVIMRVSRSLADISRRYRDSIKSYHSELARLHDQKKRLNALFGNLKTEEQGLSRLEQSFQAKKREKETLLAGVRKEKETYQKMIRDLKEDSGRLQRMIRDSERRDRSYKGKKGKGGREKYEPLPADSEFTKMKGRLSWPVHGRVAVRYGSQVDPAFKLPVFRSGIHVKSSAGSSVKAVWKGKVVYAAEFKGYGKLVVISHGAGYHSLYGNLSKIFLKNDAIIKENETVGVVGESSVIGGSGLYFEIRYKGKPLDPGQWLSRSGG